MLYKQLVDCLIVGKLKVKRNDNNSAICCRNIAVKRNLQLWGKRTTSVFIRHNRMSDSICDHIHILSLDGIRMRALCHWNAVEKAKLLFAWRLRTKRSEIQRNECNATTTKLRQKDIQLTDLTDAYSWQGSCCCCHCCCCWHLTVLRLFVDVVTFTAVVIVSIVVYCWRRRRWSRQGC